MGNKNRPVLMKDDFELMERIAKHGFVDMEYIYHFNYKGRKKRTIDDRLRQLEKYDFLIINRTFIPPEYTSSYRTGYRIIGLGKEGIRLMKEWYDLNDNIKAISLRSPYRMYHQVQVTTVSDVLYENYCVNTSNCFLSDIYSEKEVYHEEALNQPDALLIFKRKGEDGKQSPSVMVFLEIERSYASVQSLKRKIRGYHLSFKDGLYIKKFKEKVIEQRILFVTQSDLQKNALYEKLIELNETNLHILLTGYQEIVKNPHDDIYMRPNEEDGKYRLLSKME